VPKYVVIGGSVAAIGAVEAIREVDPVGTITVIAEENFSQYSRPMISDFVCGEASFEKMKYRDDGFWDTSSVQLLAGQTAVGLDLDHKAVKIDNGNEIGFEKLLLATGGRPFVPKIEGSDKNGVLTFTTFSDARRLTSKIKEAENAVVIGGGLIGIPVAEALNKCGLKVTIIELKNKILNLVLDEKASSIVEGAIRDAGVRIVTGQTVKKILGRQTNENMVGGVVLTSEEELDCDVVVMAIGVAPRIELVKDSDVKINRGIVVDEFMKTSVPEIYACGDVAEAYDFITGDNRSLPLWPLAYLGGRVAGYNMAGKKTCYPGGTAMSALKYFDIPIISVGIANPSVDDDRFEILAHHDPARNVYKKIVLKENVVVGMIFVNGIERAGMIFHLMLNHVDVKEFKGLLISDNFSLAALPSHLRKKLFMEGPKWGA
jgi:NAD(P)H-nitrite reductase large subunit